MVRKTVGQQMKDSLERSRHPQRESAWNDNLGFAIPKSLPAFTIALSRQIGANCGEIAQALADQLSWKAYDRELLQKIAAEMGVSIETLESLDERHVSWASQCMAQYTSVPTPSPIRFLRNLVRTALELAAKGNCILVGRGTTQFLPPKSTLRVRLVAPKNDRIARVRSARRVRVEEARYIVDATDHNRDRFVREHFHVDAASPENYDLIINTSDWTVAEVVQLIVEALHRLQARGTVQTHAAAQQLTHH